LLLSFEVLCAPASLVLPACLQPEHMSLFPGAFLRHLMPALCNAIVSSSSSLSDTRFFCLRIMSDCLALYLTSTDMAAAAAAAGEGVPEGAGSTSRGSAGADVQVAAALDGLLRQHVVPLVPVLLQQEDPMPLYALKVGCAGDGCGFDPFHLLSGTQARHGTGPQTISIALACRLCTVDTRCFHAVP